MNWINSWKAGNKKDIFELTFRLGKFTVLEWYYCPCTKKNCKNGRFILFNFGFEV